MATVDCDVAVVGYGPVGAALAVLLRQHGHGVVVVDRWPAPYPLPRAVHLDHEVGRILQSCGIGSALAAILEPGDVYEWRNGTGTTLLRFGRTGRGPSGWPESSMFHQPDLEALLDARARSLGVDVRRGVEVVDLVQDGAGVTLATTGADDSTTEVRCRYAVGCDGANSTLRRLTAIPVHDLGYFYDWLIVDVVLDPPRTFDPINLQVCDPARPTTAVSGGPGRRRWEFMRLPDEPLDALGDEAAAWELLAGWDVHPGNAALERHAVYTFNARYAEHWRAGRVLLAGDAAHQMPPFAGQGMCAGLRDAANLAWKLDLVLDGTAPEALLDTYDDERLPHARTGIDFSMELGKVICVPDPAEAAARDEAMSAAVGAEPMELPAAPPIAGGVCDPGAQEAGELFVQGFVEVDGRRGAFDDVHGTGWRLVGHQTGDFALDDDLAEWFASIGGRIVVIGGAGASVDVDGSYRRWFGPRPVTWVLQRPDFYLYGGVGAGGDPASLVRSLRRSLDG